MDVLPLVDGIAAEIDALDLSSGISDTDFAVLYQAWLDHPVLRFHNQSLTDPQLQEFSERFGPLDPAPVGKLLPDQSPADIPRITVISNILDNGKPIGGLGSGEAQWHTDISYVEEPAKASALFAIEIPASGGGDTHFCNMYAAYEHLPESLKDRLVGTRIKHDAAHTSTGDLRRGHSPSPSPRDAPGEFHPVIRTHPESGRKALFIGRRLDAWVEGLSLSDSEALLNEIWSYVALDEDCWVQRWHVGDLVLWDNRAVMHRRLAFDPSERRLMHRTQVHGDKPFESLPA
jgi:taurine dioxygenase